MPLVTPEMLRKLTGDSIADNDEQALETCRLAEEAVLDYLELDELPFDVTPRDERTARRIMLLLAKRNWRNPDQLRSEGGIGPLGGDSFAEEMQAGYDLTDAEKEVLDRTKIPGAFAGHSGTYVLRTTVPQETILKDIALGTEYPFWHYAAWEDRGALGL